jgi:hypothetical protein
MKPNLGARLGSPAVFWTAKRGLLVFCLGLVTPSIASAASPNLPRVDITATCRESEKAIAGLFGNDIQQTFDSCMRQEKEAREQIVKNWSKFPAQGRQRCVNPTGYMPSYVEWLTCLEMEQSVAEQRKTQGATARPATPRPATTEGLTE